MQIKIEITEDEIKKLIIRELENRLGDGFDKNHLVIEVKSKQNYRSEWEISAFRATYSGEVK